MKKDIHPEYEDATITCACGEEFETKTTTGDMRVEVCSSCHPFYTGANQNKGARGGRIERFKEKYGLE